MFQSQTKAYQLAKKMLNDNSLDDIIQEILPYNGNIQLKILDAFARVADDQGRYTGGIPSLGDDIIDRLAIRVSQYGKKAVPLSEKQIRIVIEELYEYRDVSM